MPKSESEQEKTVDFIVKRLDHLNEKAAPHKKLSEEQKRESARIIFWNLNFFTVCGIMHKIIRSLGSDKLTEIAKNVCDEINNPASFLIKHGILMSYNKNLQIDDLSEVLHKNDFSEIAKKTIILMVYDYCSLHTVTYRDRQRIESKLGMSSMNLLPNSSKK